MALAEAPTIRMAEETAGDKACRRTIGEVFEAGRAAVEALAEAERLRARAVADLVEFDAIDGHVTDGYLTPQRQLIHGAGLAEREANRLYRLVRFCADHPLLADQLAAGLVTVEHACELMVLADKVDRDEFTDALSDLLGAAVGVELSVFIDRIRIWEWRNQPEATDDEVDAAFENRSLTLQPGLFGGCKGRFNLDAAGAVVLADALETPPDPVDTIEGPRTLAQRRADRLVELAALANRHDQDLDPTPDEPDSSDESTGDDPTTSRGGPSGARQQSCGNIDITLDLPTLLGVEFDLDDHRSAEGNVDWESIQQAFALTGIAPKRVLQQFFCDANWRTLITSGGSIILDYSHAKPEINRSQRRAVQRRDKHCQFKGCDRHWRWCDVHHLRSKEDGGWDLLANLVLLCRRHHTMVHQQGWQLWRDTDGRIHTATP